VTGAPVEAPVAARRRRLSRGCGCLLGGVAILLVALIVLATQALASPDLGPAPGGADDGATQTAIAVRLGSMLVTQLAAGEHGYVDLSEHDLTVLVRENNPDPSRFQSPEIRVRDTLVVIDAHTPVGPFTIVAVAKLALARTADANGPRVSGTFQATQVGNLGLPGQVTQALQDHVQQAFNLQDLLSASPVLSLARSALECVRVGGGVVRLGFHRPGGAEDPAACG
jgi:hypothetical protein